MRSAILISALAAAAYAAPAPAPQAIDFDSILDAGDVELTGPSAGVSNQTVTISSAAVAASISAAVSVETASITGASASAAASATPTGVSKRDLGKREPNFLAALAALISEAKSYVAAAHATSTTSSSIPTTSTSTTSTPKSTSSTISTTSSSSSSSSSAPITSTTSTSTTQQFSTTTSSSSTACPTTPEEGTYCGFINPEDPCSPQPDGYGPAPTPDTVDAFYAYAPFHSMASSAPIPTGYAKTFTDLNASVSANSYLGLWTLSSYNVSACAAQCDSTDLCTAFNVYIERDPSLNPSANDSTAATVWGYWCPNPASITNYKCTLWGSGVEASAATNTGEWREQFQVVITGSNGYEKTNNTVPDTPSGYTAPTNCSGKAINAGSYNLGSKFFPGPYDPSVCATYAQAQTSKNKAAAQAAGKSSYTPCNMFNAYMVKKNGCAKGTYCSLYDTVLDSSWATTGGQWKGSDFYGIESSWTYALAKQDSGKC